MESFLQKLAKERKPDQEVTVLPVLQTPREHGATCDCGEAGCGDADGCCSS